jgi:hypothetical protein
MYLCGLAGSIFTFQCEKGMKCLLIFTKNKIQLKKNNSTQVYLSNLSCEIKIIILKDIKTKY